MCLICSEYQAGRLTQYDANLALVELRSTLTPEHVAEVILMLNLDDQEWEEIL